MSKKFVAFTVLVLILSLALSGMAFAANGTGDINGDGFLNNQDLVLMARCYVGLDTVSDSHMEAGDMNGNGGIDNGDIVTLAGILTREGEVNLSDSDDSENTYDEDDLYWLSHIIYAEAGDQPYNGMVAVGNVILNRVASPEFPNTIYDVIFQRNQFSPVSNGTLYLEPSDAAIQAAKDALDGEIAVERALFFNMAGTSSWASRNREFITRIGDHNFYA